MPATEIMRNKARNNRCIIEFYQRVNLKILTRAIVLTRFHSEKTFKNKWAQK